MRISVIIAARTGSRPVLNALAFLYRLHGLPDLEIIVVNCCGSETETEIRKAYPQLPIIDCPAPNTLLEARCAGVNKASGDPVICLHERYAVRDGWLAAIESEHREGADVAAGVLAPAPNASIAQWSVYISEYSHITAPVRSGITGPGESAMLPFGNISYTRGALRTCPMTNASSEPGFGWDIYHAGLRIVRSNEISAEFSCAPTIAEYLAERWQVSRDYAGLRALDMKIAGRAIAAVERLFLPPLLVARTLKNSRRNPVLKKKIWRALPMVITFTFVQMAAEIRGYLKGRPVVGKSARAVRSQIEHKP